MYDYFKGFLTDKRRTTKGLHTSLEVNGIGYLFEVTEQDFNNLTVSNTNEIKIYAHLAHREDSMNLYGFLTKETRDVVAIQKEEVRRYIDTLNSSDSLLRNDIENKLVKYGENAVDELIEALQTAKGNVRGTIAMSLIRIGEPSVKPLRKVAMKDTNFRWISDYLVSEILGTEAIAS